MVAPETMLGASQHCSWAKTHCSGAPNNVAAVPTMLGRSQQCAGPHNNVGMLPTLFLSFQHCWGQSVRRRAGPRKASSPEDVETLQPVHDAVRRPFIVHSRDHPKILAGGTSPPGRQPRLGQPQSYGVEVPVPWYRTPRTTGNDRRRHRPAIDRRRSRACRRC